MTSKFVSILSRSGLSEEQFLSGIPALFTMHGKSETHNESLLHLVALYKDGKVLLESTTLKSAQHCLQNADVLVDPIVVSDFDELQKTLDYIEKNTITTRFFDDVGLQWTIAKLRDAL